MAGTTNTTSAVNTTTTATTPDWWEIRLPLANREGQPIGSLVLWQDGTTGETSLSHMHVIAGDFRQQVQRKLQDLWPRVGEDRLDPVLEREVERAITLVSVGDGQSRLRLAPERTLPLEARRDTSAA